MFQVTSVTPVGAQAQRLAAIEALPTTEEVHVIRLGANVFKRKVLAIPVAADGEIGHGQPGDPPVFLARWQRYDSLMEGAFAWVGRVERPGLDDNAGQLTLVFNANSPSSADGLITGTVRIGPHYFEIADLTGGLHALVISDPSLAPPEAPPVVPPEAMPDPGESGTALSAARAVGNLAERSGDRCVPEIARALILYTPATAQSIAHDVVQQALMGVQATNQAYLNSGIYNYVLSAKTVIEYPFVHSGIGIEQDLFDLRNDPYVQQLRNEYDADIVILLAHYANHVPAGVAFITVLASGISSPNNAYAIVIPNYAAPPFYTFSHEVGHIKGADHHPDDTLNPASIPYARGHRFSYHNCTDGFCQTVYNSTVMASTPSPYSRVANFSNPDVLIGGVATGLSTRDNARVLRETAPIIADYRNPNELRGPIEVLSGEWGDDMYELHAAACGRTGYYSYEWRRREPSGTWSSILSTSQTYSAWVPRGLWEIKASVKALSSDPGGPTRPVVLDEVENFVVVFNNECVQEPGDPPCPIELPPTTAGWAASLEVFPNPALTGSEITVRYRLEEPSRVELLVLDVLGRTVQAVADDMKEPGIYVHSFSTRSLPAGLYLLAIKAENRHYTARFVLL